MGRRTSPLKLLLVEDSPEDILLTEETLKDAAVETDLQVVNDGEEALAYLRREGSHSGASTPDLVLLDLNLPRKDGREVLAEVKADPELRKTPVIVLTTSASQEDLLESYDRHANAYVRKPVTIDRFAEVMKSIDSFWLRQAELPRR